MSVKTKPFEFYLDAWQHCIRNNINPTLIKKVGFKQWEISL